MDWRTSRQLTILGVATTFLVLVVAGIYFGLFYTSPTCIDGKKNQGEEEVDCGGPCAPCAFKYQKNVEVYFSRFIQVRLSNYDVVAQLQNPNDHLMASPLTYLVRLYDDKGAEVGRRENVAYLYPNDKMYVVENNFYTERTVVRAEVSIVPDQTKFVFINELRPELNIANKKYEVVREEGRSYARVTADIFNQEPFAYRMVDVRAALIDNSGNIIGVAKTVTRDVSPGETKRVEFNWPAVPSGEVLRVDMEARTNILDAGNIRLP